MNLKKIRILSFLGITALGASLGAGSVWAAAGVDLVGAGVYSNATGNPTPTKKLGLPGGGLTVTFLLGTRLDLELGGYYLTRTLTLADVEQKTGLINGAGGLRYNLARVLYLDAGGYMNWNSTNPLGTTKGDYGVYGGLGIRIPLGKGVGILLNPRYHLALKELTYGDGGTLKPSEFVFLAGLSFGPRAR